VQGLHLILKIGNFDLGTNVVNNNVQLVFGFSFTVKSFSSLPTTLDLTNRTRPNAFDPATSAFEEGLRIFRTKLTADPKKRDATLVVTTLQDVLDEVSEAQSQYETKRLESRTRKCIVAFSKRVHYYGNVMDVVVQHHPEYASLAWGAMKIVFGVRDMLHVSQKCS
jgi:hypothetical protein